jgi:hypothetical protein
MAVSQHVTLQPGVNNFNTNLPIDRRLATNGFETWSVVSLNILNGVSAIPAESGGSIATTGFLLDNGQPLTQTVADLTAAPHYVAVGGLPPATLLMSGEVTITTPQKQPNKEEKAPNEENGGKKAEKTHPATPQLTIPAVGRIKGNAARVSIHCVSSTDCAGALRIQNLAAPGAALAAKARKPKTITYASGSFSIRAGKSVSVIAKLSNAGMGAIKGHNSLRAYANATLADGHATSLKITLKR